MNERLNFDCGLLIVLSGPSGVGKDTVLERLREKMPEMCLSVSMTTRSRREGEIDGKHYIFTEFQDFESKIDEGFFLEYAQYGANYYGTPRAAIENWLSEGRVVFLKIEVQGAEKIRTQYAESVCVFLTTPTFAELIARLKGRCSEDDDAIARRITIAKGEIMRAKEYDYIVINDVVERAADDICAIVKAERLRYKNMKNIVNEVINHA